MLSHHKKITAIGQSLILELYLWELDDLTYDAIVTYNIKEQGNTNCNA